MRFWKWLPQKTEIFRQTFQPSNLITNRRYFSQDSRHYERSKNFAGFQHIKPYLSNLYISNLTSNQSIMIICLKDTLQGLVTLIVILGVNGILLYTAAFWRCCVGSISPNTVRHSAAGDQKIYQTLQYKRHYEGHIFFPGFQNIIKPLQIFM